MSTDAILGSKRLRHPTASVRANDKLVVCWRIFGHSDCQRVIGPGAVHIHHDAGVVIAGDLFELDRRSGFAHLRQGAGGRGDIGFQGDLVGDRQQLMLLVEHGEEFAQILVSVHEAGIAFRL